LRHAAPRHLSIELTVADSVLTARIRDDGIGFDEEVSAHQGAGLLSMSERAELLDARLRVTSSAAGTLVDLRVPLPPTES
jgi:two-component system sensor histidine kinase DegS